MSITITLEPELEDRVVASALERGLPVEDYLRSLVSAAVPAVSRVPRLSMDEVDAILDELGEGSEDEPVPPVLTRAEIYADHD